GRMAAGARWLCPASRTCRGGTRQPQPTDLLQNRREQLAGHRYLRQLEGDVLGVGYYLGPDLDQFLPECGDRPGLDRLRQYQLPKGNRSRVAGRSPFRNGGSEEILTTG